MAFGRLENTHPVDYICKVFSENAEGKLNPGILH